MYTLWITSSNGQELLYFRHILKKIGLGEKASSGATEGCREAKKGITGHRSYSGGHREAVEPL